MDGRLQIIHALLNSLEALINLLETLFHLLEALINLLETLLEAFLQGVMAGAFTFNQFCLGGLPGR